VATFQPESPGSLRFAKSPQPRVATEIDRISGNRWSGENFFRQIELVDHFSFGFGYIHYLSHSLFADAIKKIPCGNRRGAYRALEPKLPKAFACRDFCTRQDAPVIQRKNLFARHDWAGGSWTKLAGLPKQLRFFASSARLNGR